MQKNKNKNDFLKHSNRRRFKNPATYIRWRAALTWKNLWAADAVIGTFKKHFFTKKQKKVYKKTKNKKKKMCCIFPSKNVMGSEIEAVENTCQFHDPPFLTKICDHYFRKKFFEKILWREREKLREVLHSK